MEANRLVYKVLGLVIKTIFGVTSSVSGPASGHR